MEEKQHTGRIYLEVAEKALELWYSDLYPVQRMAILSRANFLEIECYTGAKLPIENGCFALRRELEGAYVYLPQDFCDIVLTSDDPKEDLEAVIGTIAEHGFTPEAKGELAYKAIETIHDGWVLQNISKFFDESRKDKRFMFLRTELIGFEEARKYLLFVDPVLKALGLQTELQYIRRAYNEARRRFANSYEIHTDDQLAAFIRRAEYQPLSSSVMTAMSDPLVARWLTNQVIERGGHPSNW